MDTQQDEESSMQFPRPQGMVLDLQEGSINDSVRVVHDTQDYTLVSSVPLPIIATPKSNLPSLNLGIQSVSSTPNLSQMMNSPAQFYTQPLPDISHVMDQLPPTDASYKIRALETEILAVSESFKEAKKEACNKEVTCGELSRKLTSVETEWNKSKKDCAKYEEEIKSLKKTIEELKTKPKKNEEIDNLKKIIENLKAESKKDDSRRSSLGTTLHPFRSRFNALSMHYPCKLMYSGKESGEHLYQSLKR